jgi:RNA-directed DNA polymerase
MHAREKSDSAVVAEKPSNKAGQPGAEAVERRAEAEGNAYQQSTRRAQNRESVSQALERIRQVARQRKKEKFTALFHHISIEHLREAYFELKKDAAPGVDGLTWRAYEADLERRLAGLHARLERGAYRALPSRRVYISKLDGRQRPLAVAALEDKIVQRAAIALLNAIYEREFLGFSYGFRPGRNQHDALDALIVGITSRKVNYIFDGDLRSFFDSVSQEWLVRFLKHRIADSRMIRLIQKWLKAGILGQIRLLAPIHDAVLIESSMEKIEADVALMSEIMRRASRVVLNATAEATHELRTDYTLVNYPDRYSDKRGAVIWQRVMQLLADRQRKVA